MRFIRALLRFCTDDYGIGSIWMLCLLPLFLVLAGLGMDGTAAFRTRDMLQSTADAAALASVLQLPTGGAASVNQKCGAVNQALIYAQRNMSVAGFGNVLNSSYTSSSTCTPGDVVFGNWDGTTFTSPAGAGQDENAVQVTVKTATANSNPYPTSFLALIGKSSWDIAATAVAMNGKPTPVCVLALSDFSSNGSANTNLSGCVIASNVNMRCTGHNTGADIGFAVGTDSGCGVRQLSGQTAVVDPYAALASNIPANPCSSYPGVNWTGAKSAADMASPICGDITLTGDVTVTTPSNGSVLVIENGQLNTNGHTFSTATGSGLTIVFSGTVASAAIHAPTGNGTMNFAGAPSTGTFPNIALYQDPILTSGVDIVYSGGGSGSPTWDIGGIIYLPKANLQFKGSPNSGNSGSACLVLVAKTFDIRGTGDFLAQGGCTNQPQAILPFSLLVQ